MELEFYTLDFLSFLWPDYSSFVLHSLDQSSFSKPTRLTRQKKKEIRKKKKKTKPKFQPIKNTHIKSEPIS